MTVVWLTFVLLVLATARCTRLVTTDSITSRFRVWWFRRFPPAPTSKHRAHYLGILVDCPWCVSVWLGGGIVAIASQVTSVPLPVAVWAACSQLTGLIATKLDG